MKKIIFWLMIACMLFSMSACGAQAPPEDVQDPAVGDGITYTAYNYLTGEYNMAIDRVGARPFCVNINNIDMSWPQAGLSAADMLIEVETEGGITRIAALYTDIRGVEKIGSIRSLRHHFMEAVFPLDPIMVYCGSTVLAEEFLAEIGHPHIDADVVPEVRYFDADRVDYYAPENTWFTSGERILSAVADWNIQTQTDVDLAGYFRFAAPDESVSLTGGAAQTVQFDFSIDSTYDGDFRYDAASGRYFKFQHGDPQLDVGTGNDTTQLSFENVLVLFGRVQESEVAMLIDFNFSAGGTGYYFSNGRYEEITWSKTGAANPFALTRADGQPLVMNTGKVMLCLANADYFDTLIIA